MLKEKAMVKVTYDNVSHEFEDLDQAMAWARILGKFVTIDVNGMELVGVFGADSIKDGKCPDGVEYGWKKRRP